MAEMLLYIWIAIFLLGFFILVTPAFYSKRKFSRIKSKNYQKKISQITCARCSSKEQIINLDIILHNILLDLGYKWTVWEILKQSPEYIVNINKIWEVHKIRNNLVHNLDNNYSEKFLRLKLAEFVKEIKMLLKNI